MQGDHDKVAGVAGKAKGKVKEVTGELTGNESLTSEGHADQTKGSAKKGLGRVKNAAEELTS